MVWSDSYATAADKKIAVKIVEVGPRDGLQNEKAVIPPEIKVGLINRLGHAGVTVIEAGSFVSPKWVPQVCLALFPTPLSPTLPSFTHSGLDGWHSRGHDFHGQTPRRHILSPRPQRKGPRERPPSPRRKPPIDEIAVFTAATDAFSLANTNATVADSLKRLEPVVRGALDKGIRVRGYVSVVITCPFGGKADHRRVRDVTRELLDMGCYEVSLGDTTGTGNPTSVSEMLNVTLAANPVEKLAGHVCDHLLRITLHNYSFCFSSTILSAWESRIL